MPLALRRVIEKNLSEAKVTFCTSFRSYVTERRNYADKEEELKDLQRQKRQQERALEQASRASQALNDFRQNDFFGAFQAKLSGTCQSEISTTIQSFDTDCNIKINAIRSSIQNVEGGLAQTSKTLKDIEPKLEDTIKRTSQALKELAEAWEAQQVIHELLINLARKSR
jgi:hypothetical protein